MNFELRPQGGPRGPARIAAAAGAALLLASLLLLALAGATLAQTGGSAGGTDDAALRQARDQVLSDSRYQTERPEPEEKLDIEPLRIPPWLAEILFWGLLAVVAAFVLFFLAGLAFDLLRNRDVFKRNRDRSAEAAPRIEMPSVGRRAVDHRTLAEADRLAAQGRFSEAIHLLLLVALERLHRELGPRIAAAMTGREVLRLPALPGGTTEPLARMVQLSEINHFGGRHAAEPDYHRCRADFLRFSGEAPVAT